MAEFATKADIERLEDKVDEIKDQINKVLILEERQFGQAERVTRLEERTRLNEKVIGENEKKINAWVNRGLGAYAVLVLLFTLYEFFLKVRIA